MALRTQEQYEQALFAATRQRDERRAARAEQTRRRKAATAVRKALRAPSSTAESEAKERWMQIPWGAVCEVCGEQPATERHHAIREQTLRRYAYNHGFTFEEVRWSLDLRILICVGCHAAHTQRSRPIAYAVLRPETIALADDLGLSGCLEREYAQEAAAYREVA